MTTVLSSYHPDRIPYEYEYYEYLRGAGSAFG